MNFEAFVKDIEDNQWNVFGVEVYENGELTHSYGDTQENLHELYSATKTVLSIAVGIVYDMGLIDLDQSIMEYLPKEKVAKISKEDVQKIAETSKVAIRSIRRDCIEKLKAMKKNSDITESVLGIVSVRNTTTLSTSFSKRFITSPLCSLSFPRHSERKIRSSIFCCIRFFARMPRILRIHTPEMLMAKSQSTRPPINATAQ